MSGGLLRSVYRNPMTLPAGWDRNSPLAASGPQRTPAGGDERERPGDLEPPPCPDGRVVAAQRAGDRHGQEDAGGAQRADGAVAATLGEAGGNDHPAEDQAAHEHGAEERHGVTDS